MRGAGLSGCAAVLAMFAAIPALAQSINPAPPVGDEAAQPAPPPCTEGGIPALTLVKLEILEQLGSKVSTSGQLFSFRLAEPIVVNDCVALAAGAEGVGEVVHAKKAGFGGSAGEFVAAARYLNIGDRKLKLRSLKLVLTGRDSTGHQWGTAAMGAVGGAISPVENAAKKPNVEIPAGTVVEAKTAEAFDLFAAPPVMTEGSSNQ